MRKSDLKALEQAAVAAAETRRGLQARLGESPEESAQVIADDVDSVLEHVYEPRYRRRRSDEAALRPLLSAYDVGMTHASDLAIQAVVHPNEDRYLIWHQIKIEGQPNQAVLFEILTANLAQLVQAVRYLSIGGFEGPARSMARALVEHADLLLAVVLDEEVLRAFSAWPFEREERLKHWRRHLSPGVIKRCLERHAEALGMDATVAEEIKELRQETYEWFSIFTHGHPAALAVSAHTVPLNDVETIYRSAVLGNVGEVARVTLQRVLFYLTTFFWILDSALASRHGWADADAPDGLIRYLHRSAVFRSLMKSGIDEEPVWGAKRPVVQDGTGV